MLVRCIAGCKWRRATISRAFIRTGQARAALCWTAITTPPVPMRTIRIHVDQSLAVAAELNLPPQAAEQDRKSVVLGKSVSVRVNLGGRHIINKKNKRDNKQKMKPNNSKSTHKNNRLI